MVRAQLHTRETHGGGVDGKNLWCSVFDGHFCCGSVFNVAITDRVVVLKLIAVLPNNLQMLYFKGFVARKIVLTNSEQLLIRLIPINRVPIGIK